MNETTCVPESRLTELLCQIPFAQFTVQLVRSQLLCVQIEQ